MDILDLSLEKKNRRKCHLPQRRTIHNKMVDLETTLGAIKKPNVQDAMHNVTQLRRPEHIIFGEEKSSESPSIRSNGAVLPHPNITLNQSSPRYSFLEPVTSSSPLMRNVNSPRFAAEDVLPNDAPGIPERTKKQNRWAFNVWREWARKRNLVANHSEDVPLDVGKASEEELDKWLAKFVKEIRRKDGNPYPPHTLMQIVMGIQRYLRQQAGRPSICILDRSNPAYHHFRLVLDERIKELTSDGISAYHKSSRRSFPSSKLGSAQPQFPDESMLWETGVIGTDTALGLLNAVFYYNTVTFGIRTVDEHWHLKLSHYVIGNRGQQSQMFVEFLPSRDSVYTVRGSTKDKRVYAEHGNSRCIVKIFQKYMSLLPSDGPFYRHPQEPTLVDRSIRFSDQWIGKNRLRAMIKHIFDSTRVGGRPSEPVTPKPTYVEAKQEPQTESSENRVLSVYDRLAHAMLQLTQMRGPIANNQSPQDGSKDSTDVESTGTPNDYIERLETASSNFDDDHEPPSKIIKTDFENTSLDVNVDTHTDNGQQPPNRDSPDNSTLEITVPKLIRYIEVTRDSKRYSFQLD
uniref:uncharacterized protein KIAA1958-like n=1 Tax=Ciona intestinalis TaxID=7719 RepID=UPI00089DC8C9|nr:uncharacterized protein KIAA1958-like [Ciona intestinalis]|eukprot:XP_018669699.1 uncharacterized protein KIAA1958-like [Ciona intestinalis]